MQPFLALPRSLRWTIAILLALAIAGISSLWFHPFVDNGYDFQAFYCGGAAVAHGANPYLNEPLHSCEAHASPAIARKFRNVTVPAPLPPYALALFIPFSLLPFLWAKILWWVILVASIGVCGWAIARLTGLPTLTAYAASAVAIALPTLPQGALAPVPIALLFAAAYCIARERWTAAAICAAFATIEPHVALPVEVALFLFLPAMRLRLLAAGIAFAIFSLVVSGPHTTLYYFHTLLPQHAVSEVDNLAQFSLTTMLYHLGLGAPLAVRIGSMQYTLMLAGGVWLGWMLSKRYDDRAYLVAAPAACAVIGGSFIHLSEIAVVTLLACMLAARTNTNRAWAAVVLLAVPWEQMINWATLSALGSICLILLVWPRWRPMPALLILVLIALSLIFVRLHIFEVESMTQTYVSTSHIMAPPPNAPVDVTWKAYNDTSTVFPIWWIGKILTYTGLGLMLAAALRSFALELNWRSV
ncbi:MAG: glycosyltransferase family 87 protein [Vulcanimicrobiaceae bacterium]